MKTKLFLQLLLTLGCLALALGILFPKVGGKEFIFSAEGWWRGAIACWMLIIAIRMVYPAQTK